MEALHGTPSTDPSESLGQSSTGFPAVSLLAEAAGIPDTILDDGTWTTVNQPQLGRLHHRLAELERIPKKFTKFLLLAHFLLSTNMTEQKLGLFDTVLLEIWGHKVRGCKDPQVKVKIPSTIAKVQQKCRSILGKLILSVQTISVQDPGKKDQIAYIDPTEIVELWLSQGEVLDKLIQVNAILSHNHFSATNPAREALAAGTNVSMSEIWHSTEYFDAVQRTRCYWQSNLPTVPTVTVLFLHLGVFLDTYQVGERKSQWIVTINLLGAGRKLAGKYNLCRPVAIFKGEGRKLELGAVFDRLGKDLRELAKGVEFQSSSGTIYRAFIVVSHLMGDIPALREGLCLNIPSSCKYPCAFCRIRNYRTRPPNSRCSYACGQDDNLSLKTSQEYKDAFTDPPHAPEHMSISQKAPDDFWNHQLLRVLPGVSIPESVSIDFLHTEFLGVT